MSKKYTQERWNLGDLVNEHDDIGRGRAFKRLKETVEVVEGYREKLVHDMKKEEFVALLDALERFAEASQKLGGYAQLWLSEDTSDQDALVFMGKAQQALTAARNRVLFFELWWRGLDEKAASRLLSIAGDRRYHLVQERLFKDHTLSEPEEKVISIKDSNGVNALHVLYDMITNKFTFDLEVDGEKKTLNRDALAAYVHHPSAEVREAAYREQFRVYEGEKTVLGQIYTHRVRDWAAENVELRKFSSPVSVRNLSNDVADGAVETLLDVCRERAGVFHRYFRAKARWLGREKLRRFDIYAPLRGDEKKTVKNIPYEDAVPTVLEALGGFSPLIRELALSVFETGHIDAALRPGKRGGAFCYSVTPDMVPWVLVNYTGEPRQVATLAHELGHAVHSMLASEHSILTFHPSLPLAETASVFSEMLLTDKLLAEEPDPLLRRDLLIDTLDSMYATVLRQAFFVLFEKEAHKRIAEGITVDALGKVYLENLKEQFGDAVKVDDVFALEWLGIPHIYHAPFYCYAYSFGQLLSVSLYQRYRDEGEGFRERFLDILRYGGSESPERILLDANVDISDADFWRGGFQTIQAMVERLEDESDL